MISYKIILFVAVFAAESFGQCPDTFCNDDQLLDPDTCQCVCTIDPATCSGPRMEFDPYECICRRYPCDPLPCEPGEILNSEICDCVPDPNCEPRECEYGSAWDFTVCDCVRQECPPQECKRGYYLAPYPMCECWLACDYVMECKPGQKWDFIECGCVDACPDVYCEGNLTPNVDTCKCECAVQWECEYGSAWDNNVCDCVRQECPPQECKPGYYLAPYPMCECWLACDYVMECQPGQKWDFIECGCVDACPGVWCPGEGVPNPDTCECECNLDPADCTGPLMEFDPYECICRRYPCDPPRPCPEGEIIDWNICNCAPDPNYSSTTKRLKCVLVD